MEGAVSKKASQPTPEPTPQPAPQPAPQPEPTNSMTIEDYEALLATGWRPTQGAAVYPAKNLVVI